MVIPLALHRELTRRRFSRAHDLLADSLVDAALMLRSIVKDEMADPFARMRAAEMMFNRVLGKPRESVAIDFAGTSEPKPWERLMASAIVGNLQQAIDAEAATIIEGELVEDEEPSPDPRRRPGMTARAIREASEESSEPSDEATGG